MQFMDQLYKIEAHDAEVLSLEYSRPESGLRLLASASRDRLIHVFSVDQVRPARPVLRHRVPQADGVPFLLVAGLQFRADARRPLVVDHVGALRAEPRPLPDGLVRRRQVAHFPPNATGESLSSWPADGPSAIHRVPTTSLIRWVDAAQADGGQVQFARGHNIVGKTTFYDMEADQSQKHILTACQDRNVRVYNTSTGKHSKTFRGSLSDDGTLIKVPSWPQVFFASSHGRVDGESAVAVGDESSGGTRARGDASRAPYRPVRGRTTDVGGRSPPRSGPPSGREREREIE